MITAKLLYIYADDANKFNAIKMKEQHLMTIEETMSS